MSASLYKCHYCGQPFAWVKWVLQKLEFGKKPEILTCGGDGCCKAAEADGYARSNSIRR